MHGLGLECVTDMGGKSLRYRAERIQNKFRDDLRCQWCDERNHLLVHKPIALLDPWRNIRMRQELLNRNRQSAMERREIFEHIALFAIPEAINDRNTVGTVKCSKSCRHLGISVGRKIIIDIR